MQPQDQFNNQAQQPFQQQPMQQPQQQYQQPNYNGAKSSTTAGLLGIFLGSIGIHDFYLGYKKEAIIHIAIVGGGIVAEIIAGVLSASSLSYSSLYSGSFASKLAIAGVLSTVGGLAISASGLWGLISGIMCFTKNGKYGHDSTGRLTQ
ncbi:MAG: TM2 domain-containing protein [Candidatus Nomurabacteria bacterium]|jgi:TM2 domain-containing membrane protein YozV|nr:TM2 domain-containing protein [Candidatus Nomurabacteria bacterium]